MKPRQRIGVSRRALVDPPYPPNPFEAPHLLKLGNCSDRVGRDAENCRRHFIESCSWHREGRRRFDKLRHLGIAATIRAGQCSSRCPRYPNMWYEDAVRWAREGIEWLLGDRRIDSPAGPKSRRKLPPGCGQAAQGPRKTGNPPPVQISSATPIWSCTWDNGVSLLR